MIVLDTSILWSTSYRQKKEISFVFESGESRLIQNPDKQKKKKLPILKFLSVGSGEEDIKFIYAWY